MKKIFMSKLETASFHETRAGKCGGGAHRVVFTIIHSVVVTTHGTHIIRLRGMAHTVVVQQSDAFACKPLLIVILSCGAKVLETISVSLMNAGHITPSIHTTFSSQIW